MKYNSNSEFSPLSFSLISTNEEFGASKFMIIENQKYTSPIIER